MLPSFRLQTFGGLALTSGKSGEPVLAYQRKRLALLAVLAAEPSGGIARERLFALFWPESDGERARNALNQTVFAIRRDLGDNAIIGDAVSIRFDNSIIDSDVRRFREALVDKRFANAISIYRGAFLEGVYLRDTAEFERWAEDVRRALAGEYARALECEIDSALNLRPSRPADAVRYASLLSAHDPLSTRGAVRFMRALQESGDTAAALRHASLHAAYVREELGSEPGPELERAVQHLRAASPVRDEMTQQASPKSSEPLTPSPPTPHRRLLSRRATFSAALIAVVLATVAIARFSRRQDASARRVVIASFDNQTGDSTRDEFGRIAANVITEQLARAGFVDVVDPATALATSRDLRAGASRSEISTAALQLAQSTGARLVVTGSYFRDGDSIVAQARVTDAAKNQVVAATEPVRAPVDRPDLLVQPLRQRVMGALALRLDERLATVVPPGNTPTYEAYQAFVAGLDLFSAGRQRAAVPYFQQAYTLDTTFLAPLVWEAGSLQPGPKMREIVGILDRRRTELTETDRYALDHYSALLADDLDRALIAARNAARLNPNSHWTQGVATLLFRLGRAAEAVQVWSTVDRAHGWLRRSPAVWNGYIWALHDAGLHREELDRVREARALFPGDVNLMQDEAIALAMNRRWDDLSRRLDSLEFRSVMSVVTVGSELRVHGDREHAATVFGRCARLSDSLAFYATDVTDREALRAGVLYGCGRWSDAARLLDSLQMDARQPPIERGLWIRWLGVARARLGEKKAAMAVLDSLARDSSAMRNGGRYDAARIAALLGDRERAVELLQPLRTFPGYWLHYNPDAADFDSLLGYAPYERLRAVH